MKALFFVYIDYYTNDCYLLDDLFTCFLDSPTTTAMILLSPWKVSRTTLLMLHLLGRPSVSAIKHQ